MAEFDPRIVRLGIEVGGKLKTYEGLALTASGSKSANALQGEATIKVMNLDRDTRDFLLTETSPYNRNRRRKQVFLDAGRLSTGTMRIFQGDITSATISQPPDIAMTLKARTCNFFKGELVAKSHPTTNLSAIARNVANDLGLELVFEATDKKIANFSFTGPALGQLDQLGAAGNVDSFIDGDTLVIKDKAAPLKNVSRTLSEDSGLIGIPEVTDRGVKITMLLASGVRLGGRIDLQSRMYKALSGSYTIYKLSFEIASRDTPFYWIAECWRPGAFFVKPGAPILP
ncbi:MAG: hypothetical protein LBP58_06940 [Azoarcus sp.]|jgi:hypothetical protein|nr:hypothetical protein [Azoarcus sp.]